MKIHNKKGNKKHQKMVVVDPTATTFARGNFVVLPARNLLPSMQTWRRFKMGLVTTNQSFPLSDGHNQFLVVTNSGTGAAVPYADMWRIKKMIFYVSGVGSSPTTASTLTVIPQGLDISNNFLNDREVVYALDGNSTGMQSMIIKPGKGTPLGGWHETSNVNFAGVLFLVTASTALINLAYVDIHFEFIPSFVGSPNGYSVTTSTLTLGTLGGRSIFGGNWSPVGTNNLG